MIYLTKIMGFSGQKENRTVRVKGSTTPDCAVIDFSLDPQEKGFILLPLPTDHVS